MAKTVDHRSGRIAARLFSRERVDNVLSGAVKPPFIMFRVDASPTTGGARATRCVAVAEALQAAGARVAFASAPGGADVLPVLRRWDVRDPAPCPDADVVVLDGRHLGAEAAQGWEASGAAVAAFGEASTPGFPCRLRIVPAGERIDDAQGASPSVGQVLLGPGYAPMSADFARFRPATLARRSRGGPVQVVLVSADPTDAAGAAPAAAQAALDAFPNASVDVAVASGAPTLSALRSLAADRPRMTVHLDPDTTAQLVAGADLGIASAGALSWEHCALGLPSVVLKVDGAQQDVAAAVSRAGAAIVVRSPDDIAAALREFQDAGRRRLASEAAAALCDGRGAFRVADALLELVRRRSAGS